MKTKTKNKIIVQFLIISVLLLIPIVLATPNTLNIQGKLTDSSDSLVTGYHNFTFKVYDSYTSGTKLYETSINATTDSRGVYDVILQNVDLPFDQQYYLAVQVDTDAEMSPRVNLTSVPYSFTSNKSRALNTTRNVNINENINLTTAGNIDAAGTITADTLQAITQLNVAGGFNAGGLTIQSDGNIVTQGDILFSGNVTVLNVSHLRVNGSSVPSLDNAFDVGNASLRWRSGHIIDLVAAGSINVGGSLNASSINITGNSYFATSSGNVGIGTSTPTEKLDIRGNLSVNVSTDGTKNVTLFVDSTNERVGIGTSSPGEMLHIKGNNANLKLQNDGDTSFFQLRHASSNRGVIELNNSGEALIDIDPRPVDGTSNAAFRFFRFTNTSGMKRVQFFRGNISNTDDAQIGVNGTDSFFQVGGGSVGIGTANPGSPKLNVSGGNISISAASKAEENTTGIIFPDGSFFNGIPSGAVLPFNSTICPTGWSNFTQAFGRVIIGVGQGNDGTETLTVELGDTEGEYNHTLTEEEMPSHTHSYTHFSGSLANGATFGVDDNNPKPDQSATTGSGGNDDPHNNVQPYYALLYCVKD